MGANRSVDRPRAAKRVVLLSLAMSVRSIALFAAAALAEIGGAYMVWVGLRQGRGPIAIAIGAIALVLYGLIVTRQPSSEFGRVLAGYGGVFVVGSLLWGVVFDGFKPDRFDLAGAVVCLVGIGTIMYMPR
jgi:small multidrug resistance family-3 protein